MRVSDRISLAILGLCCGGTFIALSLTSVAKKAGQTGPPAKPDMPWLKGVEASFDERLKQMDVKLPQAVAGSGGSGSDGSDKAAS